MSLSNPSECLKNLQQKLFIHETKKRKCFGLLEKPSLPPSVPQVSFKLYIYGQSGSGKSSFIRKLTGNDGEFRHGETLGIEMHYVYWPMKIGNRIMLFRLEIWDAGEGSAKKYNHIRPTCFEAADAVLICVSTTSREQWAGAPKLMAKASEASDKSAIIVVTTKFDLTSEAVVSEAEIRAFESSRNVLVLRHPLPNPDGDTSIPSHTLNTICRKLWQRDQDLLSVSRTKN